MKKTSYIVPWIIFGLIAGFIIWFAICFANVMHTPPPLDFEAAKNKFYQNREQFIYVAEYFVASGCKHIYPEPLGDKTQKKYINPKDLPNDSKLYVAINNLFKNGCECFENDWGAVKFLMWDAFEMHRGILYLTHDIANISDSFIKIEKICDNWYYYEESTRIVPKVNM